MVTRTNGNKWKIIVWATSLLILGAGIVGTFAVLGSDVKDMKPEVKANTEYRLKDEQSTLYFERRFDRLEATQDQILIEVRK